MNESEIWSALRPKRKPVNRVSKKRRKSRVGKLGIVRLDAKGMKALREERYAIDEGKCVECGEAWPMDGEVFSRMHLAHIKSRGAGGSDTLENTRSKCPPCHLGKEHGPKWSNPLNPSGPVPSADIQRPDTSQADSADSATSAGS